VQNPIAGDKGDIGKTLVTDKPDPHSVYGRLLVRSEKHLHSYIRALKERGAEYSPQYLSEEEFDKVANM